MFGRATITLGIGPHSSLPMYPNELEALYCTFDIKKTAPLCNNTAHIPYWLSVSNRAKSTLYMTFCNHVKHHLCYRMAPIFVCFQNHTMELQGSASLEDEIHLTEVGNPSTSYLINATLPVSQLGNIPGFCKIIQTHVLFCLGTESNDSIISIKI